MSKIYNIFISHSWTYDKHYQGLLDLLEKDKTFKFKNYSVPKSDPIHNTNNDEELLEAIKNKIAPSSVILILAGKYSTYSKWINKEIAIANNSFTNKKPIIGIEYWGSSKTSSKVKDSADKLVNWQYNKIIEAIKELG